MRHSITLAPFILGNVSVLNKLIKRLYKNWQNA